MRRIAILCTLLILSLGANLSVGKVALAESPHFKKGGTPTCTITSTSSSASVTCTGTLAGLGGEDVGLNLSVSGFALYQCQNAGGNTAAGQNKVLEGPATSQTLIPANQIKNGNLTFTTGTAALTAEPTVSGATAGCPNPNWTGVNPTLTATSITLLISQPPGTTIFTCTASNPNGLSGKVTLSCS